MARYIDADKLIEFITKGLNNPDNTKAFGYDAIAILTEIEYAPTADVVEVVRCKVCRQYVSDILSDGVGYCNEYGMKMLENDFCSYGERKGDAE